MNLKGSWLGAKRRNNFVTRICVLMFSLNAAFCEIFCPPAVKNAAYNVTAEKYNIAAHDLGTLIATWYMGTEVLTSCNFTSNECVSSGSKPKFPLTFQVFVFGTDDIQMTLLIDKLTPNLQQTFSVHWDYAKDSSVDSCQVTIGGPVDECSTQKPCLNGADCSDLQIGYHCGCKEGFSGMTCREGDLRLRCTPSSYRIVFNQQTNACADFNISCSVAGVASQDDISLNLTEVSNNGSSDLSLTSNVANNTVFFELCITHSTRFGNYEIIYKLQAPRAMSGFNLHILPELNNVTTPPEFNTPAPGVPYVFDVPEDALPGQVIIQVNKSQSQSCSSDVCIQVLDPDVSSIIGVSSLVLGVDSESQQQPVSIAFKNNNTISSFGFFYVNGELTSGTSITFRLTVTDGSQASASASVIFKVTDVNHPPVCKTDTVELDLDIRQQPVKNLAAVSCSDSDSIAVFRGITYVIEGQLSKYFNISSDGVIMLCHSVQDLEPGLHTFNVTATGYSVSPDPAFVFYIPVHVNLTVPEPRCNLSVSSLPDVWEANRTAELRLECDIQGVDKLTMISWNLVDVFNISVLRQSPTVYIVTLVVKQYKPANYNFEVVASLGGPTSTASVKVAMYNRPRFNAPTYAVTISDTTPKGSKVVTLAAVTDVPGSTLTFRIWSGNNGSLFSLGNNGTLYLAQEPVSSAGSTVRLLVEVQDTVSGLNDTADIIVHISDNNQPPICADPTPVKINSNLAINSVVTKITCNDSDITPEFKNLSYSITAAGQFTGVFGVRNSGEIILLKELPAGITSLSVTVNVSDASLFTLVELNITVTVVMCPSETTEFGLIFPETPVNSVINVSCPQAYTGVVSRRCYLNQTWSPFTYNTCTRKDLANASALLANLKANASQVSPEVATAAVKSVADQLSESLAMSGTVLSGDIKQMVELLKGVGEVTELFKGASLADGTLKSFASSSDLIIGADVAMWQQAATEADEGAKMLQALDSITSASIRKASFEASPVVGEHLAIKRGISKDSIVFPDSEDVGYHNHSGWVLNSNNTAILPKAAFASHTDSVKYSVILYKNVTEKFKVNNSLQERVVRGKVINSDILSFNIDTNLTVLSPPLVISFPILQPNYSEPLCGYLNTSASVSGVWATKGCTAEVFSDRVKCSCNHLTNFAVLMSPFGSSISSTDEEVLSIISAVGCGLSMLCLVITVIIYIILWKYVKCDRAVLHVNLSVCLILAYVVFLLGVHRTDSEVGCKVVAALLHFLFLVVFFTMLCEGIEVFKSVTFVFTSDSIIRQLLLISYGVPVIIVAVSLGATQTKGYGSATTCWLSVDDGLIWAFVAPALLVIVINLIILIRVLRIMQHSNLMMVKTAQQRTKSVVRTICVLSPLLGITWVFGVLSVSKDTVVFQYLFAIFNSLQGLFIFICYCVLTPQVIDGFRAMRRKYRARSFDSNQRGISSSFSGKYSESEAVSAKHKKHSRDFKSSFVNTNTTSMRDSSQTASSDCTDDKHAYIHKYGRRESNDSRKTSLSDCDSVFNHHGVNKYGGEIPLSYTDPRSRINSQPFVDVGYPGTFFLGHT